MRTTIVGVIIGVCILTSSCRQESGKPIISFEPTAVTKDKSFAEYCVSEQNLGKELTDRCRDELEIAESDRKRGWK